MGKFAKRTEVNSTEKVECLNTLRELGGKTS